MSSSLSPPRRACQSSAATPPLPAGPARWWVDYAAGRRLVHKGSGSSGQQLRRDRNCTSLPPFAGIGQPYHRRCFFVEGQHQVWALLLTDQEMTLLI